MAGILPLYPLRIGYHRLYLLLDLTGRIRDLHGVSVALGHLPVIDTQQPRRLGHYRLGLGKYLFFIKKMEPACDLARELQMRQLVIADWHGIRLVYQYISRLQNRITEKTVCPEVSPLDFPVLLFICRAAFEPRERRYR